MREELKHFFSPKELAAALSLANLFYLRVWQELIFADPEGRFYLKSVTPDSLLAVLLNVLILGLLFRGAVYFYRRRSKGGVGKWGGLFLFFPLLIPLNALRLLVPGFSFAELSARLGTAGLALLIALFFTGVITAATRQPGKFSQAVYVALLVLSPFFLLTFSQALWVIITLDPSPPARTDSPEASQQTSPPNPPTEQRVLWLVFDELDQRMTFEKRPPDLETPELDAIKQESIFAEEAYPPGEDTVVSMPAFITGRRVKEAEPASPDELQLTFADYDKQPLPWSEQENIFSRLHALGYDTALAGVYLPYCRVIGHTVTNCYWQPFGTVELKDDRGLPGTMLSQLASILSISPFNQRKHAIDLYRLLLEEAKIVAADSRPGLGLVHWSIPHYPWIYNRRAGDYTLFNYNMQKGYFDNLALVDRTLGELRREMEEAGTWEHTHIVITSDHPWRMELFPAFDRQFDPRVPFMLRLAGQEQPEIYRDPFDTTLIHDLVLKLLGGRLTEPEEVIEWMEQQPLPPEAGNS